jgi:DNA modification methylase
MSTGFSLPEVDIVMQPEPEGFPLETDELPQSPAEPVSRNGDLWMLDEHRLLCGDALDERSYALVLGLQKADACFTDPPWNIPIEGFVSGLGSTKHKDFKMAAGEMTEAAFQEFVDAFSFLISHNLEDGGIVYSCIDWRSHDKIVLGGKRAGLCHVNTVIWNKGSGGMGGLYRSAHELIPVFCKGKSPKTNNVELGRHGRDRTNVWSYSGANRLGSSAAKALKHHPTPKPVEMVEDALLDVSARGELVLDPFMGSGTTLLAAERSHRIAAGIELDPAYVDVCIRRWQEMTGKAAVLADSHLTFEEIATSRASEESIENGEDDHDQ